VGNFASCMDRGGVRACFICNSLIVFLCCKVGRVVRSAFPGEVRVGSDSRCWPLRFGGFLVLVQDWI
jgi:hypothetical protein